MTRWLVTSKSNPKSSTDMHLPQYVLLALRHEMDFINSLENGFPRTRQDARASSEDSNSNQTKR